MAGLLWYRSYMDSLANTSGYYPDIHAGRADRVAELTLTAPYLVRETPAGNNQLELMELVGGTVAWNQLCSANIGNSFTAPANTNTLKQLGYGYGTAIPYVAGHKYLFQWTQADTVTSTTRNGAVYHDGSSHYDPKIADGSRNSMGRYYWLFSAANTYANGGIGIWCNNPDVNVTYKDYILMDLTQMFGSTIANYVYSLEQATAGSGIEWLKSYDYFTEDYYAYSAPTLQSVEATAHVTKDSNNTTIATYPLDSDLVLRGILKKDADGNLYYDGDEYLPDGTVNRRFAEATFDGTENWVKSTSYPGNYYLPQFVFGAKLGTNAISTFTSLFVTNTTQLSNNDNCIMFDGANISKNINVKNSSIATLNAFKTWLSNNPLTVVYELVESAQTTESADPFTAMQTVEEGGTEEFVTGNNVPVGNVSVYRRA